MYRKPILPYIEITQIRNHIYYIFNSEYPTQKRLLFCQGYETYFVKVLRNFFLPLSLSLWEENIVQTVRCHVVLAPYLPTMTGPKGIYPPIATIPVNQMPRQAIEGWFSGVLLKLPVDGNLDRRSQKGD
jgi:hypothetical protein